MFKKLKDKLTEEMKQSPARLQASMQQLVQVVPSITNISSSELSMSNDNFSVTECNDETPKNTPDKYKLQSVDLTSYSSNSMGLSRTSSVNSVTSTETSGLFPIYESPGSTYHLQSDMDQSASEIDEHISPQFDQISKEQIYAAYCKVQTKYHKYRGRYTDLANYYREMERAKCKLESLLVETQDKALRRIADLKEQCQLEQQAKAHLEEALRNDIEEKNHIIDTLNTKANSSPTLPTHHSQKNLINIVDNKDNIENDSSESVENIPGEQPLIPVLLDSAIKSQFTEENLHLKIKLDKLENLLLKYKESLKRSKDKITEMNQDKLILERDLESMKISNNEQFQTMNQRLIDAEAEIITLNEKINVMKQVEEQSAISLAENKLSIHRELEIKEEQIKKLELELKNAMQIKENVQLMVDSNLQINDSKESVFEEEIEKKVVNSEIKSTASSDIKSCKHAEQEETIKKLNEMIEKYLFDIDETKKIIETQNIELIRLTKISKDNYEMYENKSRDFDKLENEIVNCHQTINQLNTKLEQNENLNDNLIKEKNKWIEHIVKCMSIIRSLKDNYQEVRLVVKTDETHRKEEFFHISKLIQTTLHQYQSSSIAAASSEKIECYENQLQEKNTEITNIKKTLSNFETSNKKLLAELENAHCEVSLITKNRNDLQDCMNKIEKEKALLASKFEEIEKKYISQVNMIEMMSQEMDLLRQSHSEQEEKIKQYNDEKQYLMKNAEQATIFEEKCKYLSDEIAEITARFENRIASIESENETYKNNAIENMAQLQDSINKYNTIVVQYENEKLEVERNKLLLQEESAQLQKLIADNLKHSENKIALNMKIDHLTEIVQSKNDYIENLKHLNAKSKEIIQEKDLDIQHLVTLKKSLENFEQTVENERLQTSEIYSKRIEELTNEKVELLNKNMELITKDSEYKDLQQQVDSLLEKNEELKLELIRQQELNDNLLSQIQENHNLMISIENLRNYKEQSEIEKKQLKNVENELSKANRQLQDSKNVLEERIDELETLLNVRLKEIAQLKEEIQNKTIEIEEIHAKAYNESQLEESRLQRVVEELKSQLQEKESICIARQATQSQIESMNNELRNDAERLREQLVTSDTEQTIRMQQLVKEFQARLHDKDIELQAALDKKFDWQKNYESELIQQYREQLKDFQHELTAKSEEIEELKMRRNPENNNEIEKLIKTIETIKQEHANELKESDLKWRETLKQTCDQLEAKYSTAFNESNNKWRKNQLNDENVAEYSQDLENMSAMAMAAVQSNTGSFHSLQQTLITQRRELSELRKLVKIRRDTMDDSTEIEYLRNILYEYMMGKETLVLARVIAAVVKFDQDQTNKVLKKEEDKLTLLGSLGLT